MQGTSQAADAATEPAPDGAAALALQSRIDELGRQLAETRARPMRTFAEYLQFRILGRLSRMAPPLPVAMAARFGRSAQKRDPYRGAIGATGAIGAIGSMGAAVADHARGYRIAGRVTPDPTRGNVLIVAHEASRTGAPILALNLVEHLSKRYNVTVLTLRGGPCVPDFVQSAVEVWRGDDLALERPDRVVEQICAATRFSFAIVNSAESSGTLGALRRAAVPTVTLVHEFVLLYRSAPFLERIATLSDEIVFSSEVTRGSALAEHSAFAEASLHVIAQGKCRVPVNPEASDTDLRQESELRQALRPPGPRAFVVLGAGSVNLRKGVDLFIETARKVLTSPDGQAARFFWIGGGYDPQFDVAYSVYLRDQLVRAGIADRVTFLPATPFIETAYAEADALVLSSRLDPLPNVGLDAIAAGLPVLCFDRATGLAEQLDAAGLRASCIADYLDCGDMAAKIVALASDPALRAGVSAQLRGYAAAHLDFADYAGRIEAVGLRAAVRASDGRR